MLGERGSQETVGFWEIFLRKLNYFNYEFLTIREHDYRYVYARNLKTRNRLRFIAKAGYFSLGPSFYFFWYGCYAVRGLFPEQMIARFGDLTRPPRSPDLTLRQTFTKKSALENTKPN